MGQRGEVNCNFGSNFGRFGSGRSFNGRGAPIDSFEQSFSSNGATATDFTPKTIVCVQPVPTRELQGARKSPL